MAEEEEEEEDEEEDDEDEEEVDEDGDEDIGFGDAEMARSSPDAEGAPPGTGIIIIIIPCDPGNTAPAGADDPTPDGVDDEDDDAKDDDAPEAIGAYPYAPDDEASPPPPPTTEEPPSLRPPGPIPSPGGPIIAEAVENGAELAGTPVVCCCRCSWSSCARKKAIWA